ncbi:MAG: peptide MFS transporter [Chitinophagales bacterium]
MSEQNYIKGLYPDSGSVLSHPSALFVLFFTEMWERFSYYGMRALFVLFLTTELAGGGWGWSNDVATSVYGWYIGLVYLTPVFGGMIADRFLGYRWSVAIGALIMTLGHVSLTAETPTFFYLGLGLLIIGNGLFKPNISSIVGQLYGKQGSERKDAAYTIFYMGINAGAFLGILLCGYIGEKVSWSYGFGLAGIFMFFGLLQFWFSQKILGQIGLTPAKVAAHKAKQETKDEEEPPEHVVRDRLMVIGIFAFVTIFFWMAFEQAGGSMTIFANDYTERVLTGSWATLFFWINTALTIGPLAIITWVLFKLFSQTFSKYALSNIFLGSSFVIIWGLALWMLNKEYNTKTYEVQLAGQEVGVLRIVDDLAVGTAVKVRGESDDLRLIAADETAKFEGEQTVSVIRQKTGELEVQASWFAILNSFFIILFAPLFSRIWQTKYNPSGPVKFGIGLILLGIGFAALAYGGLSVEKGATTASVSMMWLVVAYLFHTLGELCISPVGLSYVSKLAPVRLVSMMFGVWFLSNFVAGVLAGQSASYIDYIAKTYSISTFFLVFAIVPITVGLMMFVITPFMKRKMHGIY